MEKIRQAVLLSIVTTTILAFSSGCERNMSNDPPANIQRAMAIRTELERGIGGSGKESEELPEPTGYATITGSFKISGTPPANKPVLVSGDDSAYCSPGGNAPFEEVVQIGQDGGIGNVLIFLNTKIPLDDPKWIHSDYQATETAEVEFNQVKCMFVNRMFAMRSTQKLKILNSDPVGHNTKLEPRDKATPLNQTVLAKGFLIHEIGGEEKQPFSVKCSIHSWMNAYIISRDSPYFAVSKQDGTFTIENVPAGVELEFRVWQEKSKWLESVSANGEDQKWSKGKFTLTLEPGESHSLDIIVDASVFK